ncbi:MAG: formate dehydrogenase accessory sulfurtransferase FdhD [Rhizomicrobium sp.]
MTVASRDFPVRRLAFTGGQEDRAVSRAVPVEAPVSFEVCGIGYAVMMATPSDLQDYALGFALTEGLASCADDVEEIDVHETEGGWILRIALASTCRDTAFERARKRISESSCGLCGVENIQQVLRPLPFVTARISTNRAAIEKSLAALWDRQPLAQMTGAVHAAAFCNPEGQIACVREDVGRHNALDKLIGALASQGASLASGFIVLTARCSYELVEKTARMGCPMLVTVSAPTSLAIERAKASGLTLVALARADSALIVCDDAGNIAR